MVAKRVLLLMCVLSLLVCSTGFAAKPLPPATDWMPAQTLASLEITEPNDLLDLALNEEVVKMVTESPAYKAASSQPNFQQFIAIVNILETTLNVEWAPGVRKLIGGGITLAAVPNEAVVLIVDAEDADLLKRLHDVVIDFSRGEARNNNLPDPIKTEEYQGVTIESAGGEEVHAIVGNRFILSNKRQALKAVLDLRAHPSQANLSSLPAYKAARKAAGADATALAFVNLALIKQHPPIRSALEQGPNPAASLLIPGVTEALRESNWVAIGLHADKEKIALRAVMDGKTDPPQYITSDDPKSGALPNFSVPRQIASMSFYRDLYGFYSAKDDLFPERTSGLIFFENMMGIFFSGRDLTEEVLAATAPETRFVVAEQKYDPTDGVPQIQYPSFAAIFRLHDAEKFAIVAEEAWQKALGLVNFTRGQQALSGLIIDRPTHNDTKFSKAYFSVQEEEDKSSVDSRFNFQPSLAVVGDFMIISSAEGLTCDLIDALKKEAAAPIKALAETHSLIELDIAQLGSILSENRDNLVRQMMVAQGQTQEQAEVGMDLITSVLERFGRVKLNMGSRNGLTEANLEIVLNLP